MKKTTLQTVVILSLILLRFFNAGAQTPETRGIYVSNINDILSSTSKTDSLLNYIQAYQFNYITLYSLRNINWSSSFETGRLAGFIKKAKTNFGVKQIGASGEKIGSFTSTVIPYNNSRTDTLERFDVLNFEFEFWSLSQINANYCNSYLSPNGYSCDTSGAFAYSFDQLKKIDSLSAANGMISEIYIGWPNTGQLQQIASVADRILVHAYRSTDVDVYAKSKVRLAGLASLNKKVEVMPIFSSEPLFMNSWLNTNPLAKPFDTYSRDMQNDTGTFRQFINLQGYQWYVYDYMLKVLPPLTTITTSGATSLCAGASTVLTASAGASYLWSTGDTSRSITVYNPGSYSVSVMQSYGAVSTSSVLAITSASPQPISIVAGGSTSFCAGDSVILTAGSATSYLWSTGDTTRSITIRQTGDYFVYGNYQSQCGAVSNSIRVKVNIRPAVPIITSSSSLSICQGKNVVLTSSTASGYRWSNGETTRSIVVSTPGNYYVRIYSGPNCYSNSITKTVTLLSNPSIPVVMVTGSTTLTASNPSVRLSSSSATAYSWTNGSTSRYINVQSQGSYRVTVTGSNGCKATSSAVTVSANGCTPPPVPVISYTGSLSLPAGDSIQLFAPAGSYGYRWSNGKTTSSIWAKTGTYTVRIYNSGYCFSESLPVSVISYAVRMAATSNDQGKAIRNIQFYPNPVKEFLHASVESSFRQKAVISLVDLTGRTLFTNTYKLEEGQNDLEIDLLDINSGFYNIILTDSEGIFSGRIVIE